MKLIKAFIHHVRTPDVVQALADAGFRNITLQDVRGVLKPVSERELDYSVESGGLIISETRLSLVVKDEQVDKVTSIIRAVGHVGPGVSGYVYVSAVEMALPIEAP
ncbi:MAG: P-II family nitrogen regulator [Gammaproteobacteria bacterium]|nr:P-II family nitrogen regulator [Gammaproteobacteria bacterium]